MLKPARSKGEMLNVSVTPLLRAGFFIFELAAVFPYHRKSEPGR